MNFEIIEIVTILVFFIGLYSLITGKSAIKGIVSIVIMEIAVIMFFLSIGFSRGMLPPIMDGGRNAADSLPPIEDMTGNVADPLPQALVITAIIIGVAVTAVNLTMLIALYRKFKSAQWDTLREKVE